MSSSTSLPELSRRQVSGTDVIDRLLGSVLDVEEFASGVVPDGDVASLGLPLLVVGLLSLVVLTPVLVEKGKERDNDGEYGADGRGSVPRPVS